MKSLKTALRTRPLFEELEPRILYSADASALLNTETFAPSAEVRSINLSSTNLETVSSAQTVSTTKEIIFVDSSISNYQELVDSIVSQNSSDSDIEIVMLDSNQDGISQISETLSQYKNLDAVHLISHGSDGIINIGNNQLNIESLIQNQSSISEWGNAFNTDADFLIYGCNVAETTFGQNFIDYLSYITHADVAASTDATGSALLDGDWALEYKKGVVETQAVIDSNKPNEWVGLLAVTSNSAVTSAQTANSTSLTWSHTVNNGTDRALFVELAIDASGVSATSVTYNGVAMTLVGTVASNNSVEIWALANPTVGTANIVANFSGSTSASGGANTFNGVSQSSPYGTFSGASGSGSTGSVIVNGSVGDQVIDVQYWEGLLTLTADIAGAGQTIQWSTSPTLLQATGSTIEAGGASVTMSGTALLSSSWVIGAVSVNANDAPTTSLVTLTAIAEDSGARLITQAELLANAADADGDGLTATGLTISSGGGNLVDNGNGTWSYTPALNDDTAVAFSYSVTDGTLTAAGTAALDITAVNDAPTTSLVTLTAIAEDSGARLITQAELLANAADADGDGLTATGLTISSGGGNLVDNGNGTWSYTPALNDDTAVAFSYSVTDGTLTAAGTAALDITAVNDAPTTSLVTLTAIAEDSGARLITQAELLANAADADGDGLTATGLTISSGGGNLVDNGNGTWSYTPALNDDTAVAFSYSVTDGTLTAAGTAALDITLIDNSWPYLTFPDDSVANSTDPIENPPTLPSNPTNDNQATNSTTPPSELEMGNLFTYGNRNNDLELNSVTDNNVLNHKKVYIASALPSYKESSLHLIDPFQLPELSKLPTNQNITFNGINAKTSVHMLNVEFDDQNTTDKEDIVEVLIDHKTELLGFAISASIVTWAAQYSTILTSLLAIIPAWKNLDPIEILDKDENHNPEWEVSENDTEDQAEDTAVDILLENSASPSNQNKS